MIFSSYSFVLLFLPIVFLIFWMLRRMEFRVASVWWLIGSSIFFYSSWRLGDTVLLLATIGINFVLGSMLSRAEKERRRFRSILLTLGLCWNIGLLVYFKYLDFAIENLSTIFSIEVEPLNLALPLGISFFSFQQSAFLIEVHRGQIKGRSFSFYLFFVSFFPQLVAGPIVNFSEISNQWNRLGKLSRFWENLAVGLGFFGVGLFKKIVIADGLAGLTSPFFAPQAAGWDPAAWTVWFFGLIFLLQVYFDFSSYSDMAIGLARLFGITLPINFYSPLKATSILDYWRRWHVTLTRFTTSYVFNPLALKGQRRAIIGDEGPLRLAIRGMIAPLLVTFIVVGVWHGAGWNFVLYGVIHGIYATVNHFWMKWPGKSIIERVLSVRGVPWIITTLALIPPIITFRAESTESLWILCCEMFSISGEAASGVSFSMRGWLLIVAAAIIAWFFPNSQQWMGRYRPALDANGWLADATKRRKMQWRANWGWGLFVAGLYFFIWFWNKELPQEFIYFEF